MRTIVALLAVLAMVSVAGAAEQVWFVASGPGIVTQGAPGVSTVLLPGTYGIDVYVGATDSLYGFDIALAGVAGDVASGLTTTPIPATGWLTDFAVAGAGASLLHVGQSSLGAPWSGTALVNHFELVAVQGDIIAGTDPNGYGWGDATGGMPPVQFGSFWISDSSPGMWTTGPAIQVLPEPTTLVLLGLGLVGLLRRR